MSVVFDKLAFVRRLETENAFSRGQAEALSEALHTAVSETVATKADLTDVRHEIAGVRHEVASVRSELKHEMQEFRVEVKHEIGELRLQMEHGNRELRAELKLWTGSLAAGLFAALSGLAVAMRFLTH